MGSKTTLTAWIDHFVSLDSEGRPPILSPSLEYQNSCMCLEERLHGY